MHGRAVRFRTAEGVGTSESTAMQRAGSGSPPPALAAQRRATSRRNEPGGRPATGPVERGLGIRGVLGEEVLAVQRVRSGMEADCTAGPPSHLAVGKESVINGLDCLLRVREGVADKVRGL